DGGGEWNRLDDYEVAFHQRVRAGYHAMIAAEPHRWVEVDGAQPPEVVQKGLQEAVLARLLVQE
ncbi:MAG: dTMP kinase, partial [Chloroflexi bacterium]|nr:dTMP kinase [Chloroflexota bacterium]